MQVFRRAPWIAVKQAADDVDSNDENSHADDAPWGGAGISPVMLVGQVHPEPQSDKMGTYRPLLVPCTTGTLLSGIE